MLDVLCLGDVCWTLVPSIIDVRANDKASYVHKGQAAKGFESSEERCKYEIAFARYQHDSKL